MNICFVSTFVAQFLYNIFTHIATHIGLASNLKLITLIVVCGYTTLRGQRITHKNVIQENSAPIPHVHQIYGYFVLVEMVETS